MKAEAVVIQPYQRIAKTWPEGAEPNPECACQNRSHPINWGGATRCQDCGAVLETVYIAAAENYGDPAVMKAGPMLNSLIEQVVFNRRRIGECPLGDDYCPGQFAGHREGRKCARPFSTQLNEAILVVEELQQTNHLVTIKAFPFHRPPGSPGQNGAFYTCGVTNMATYQGAEARGEWLALAICRAALAALPGKQD